MSKRKIQIFFSGSAIFIGMFILGIILRLWHLGSPSLWLDEAISFFRGQMPFRSIVDASYGWDVHPPTYYLILHLVEKFGQSEFAIRLFSALCGIAAIPILFQWVRTQFGKKEALWAVFFQVGSIFHLRYSQEARVYALFYLVSLFVMFYFYKAYDSGKRKYWILWSLFSILNFYIHYYSLILLLAQLMYYLGMVIFNRARKSKTQKLSNFILSICILGAGCLPQFFMFINQASSKIQSEVFWQVSNPLQFGLIFLRSQINPFLLSYSVLDRALKYFYLLFFILAIGIWWEKIKQTTYPVTILVLSVLLGWISSFLIYFSGTFRYLVFLNAPFCILLGVSIGSISEHLEDRMSRIIQETSKIKMSIMVLLIMIFGSIQVFLITEYYHSPRKPDWRRGISQIIENGHSEDVVVPIPGYSDYVARYYLLQKADVPHVIRINHLTVSKMDSLKSNYVQVFFTLDGKQQDSPQNKEIEKWLQDNARLIWTDRYFRHSAIWLASANRDNLPKFIKK